jgi:phage-related minor tail protein
VGQRLAEAREQATREATKDRRRPPGTAIALRDKDIELRDFYQSTSQARGTWQAHRASAGYSSSARRAGDRAGRRARLGNSPELPGARSALRR